MSIHIEESAVVHPTAVLEDGVKIWHNAQVRENARIGKNVIIGKNAYIGAGVEIGDNCKIQNNAMIYEPAKLHNGVFIGPGVILTNDKYPRAKNIDGSQKSADDWDPVGVEIFDGASIGAGAICVAPVKIGRWAVVGAGSVVTTDVKEFVLVLGSPARPTAYVGYDGRVMDKITPRIRYEYE